MSTSLRGACSIVLILISILLQADSYSRSLLSRRSYYSSTRTHAVTQEMLEQVANDRSEQYPRLALSGFVNKESDFADSKMFVNLFEKGYVKSVKAMTDDVKFARKRLVNPKTVYSGLIDVLSYDLIDYNKPESFEAVLGDVDAWLALNVSIADLPLYAAVAAKLKLQRVVWAVNAIGAEECGADITFSASCDLLKAAGVNYTVVKYAAFRKMEEGKFPYRVVSDAKALPEQAPKDPTSAACVSQEDLLRVLCEALDIPKTYNNVYGIGPGSKVDNEIMIYMKSRGWPERVQVGLLMGDFMETVDKMMEAENKRAEEEKANPKLAVPKAELGLPAYGQVVSKGAGFFV